ncbi:sucrose-6-phosphate hydrolase [Halobacillus campisalis]|uniref:Sucrose-6-phosphate hydrolase n=1 Tax=Halobacillus campisalis TaxID=435909 RepID=A0ABW2K4Q1_9BACI|nr:sucrose-6-phosphate hydrolase [Halobacillus campisalis]
MTHDSKLREQAYEAVKNHHGDIRNDPYYPSYHLAPPVGLLNDPNGWIQWKGKYHLFFQWMPFHTGHGAKFWGHYSTTNLVDWSLEPIALTPSDWFDKNGCYSGSAVDDDGLLKLFYTGNVKDESGQRESYQCLAESADGVTFSKKGVKLELPEGYTPHFRDPKVWFHNGLWYMVIGAQTEDEVGSVALFESEDLESWTHRGMIAKADRPPFSDLGYMWECPDLFELDGQEVLLFSPQGLEADRIDFNNQYQSGYVVGRLDYEKAELSHDPFVELDRGFEFYAPQTTMDDLGRRILIGWMGVPDQNEAEQPTVKNGWIHQMTLPRELVLIDGRIHQLPLEEMKNLRASKSFSEDVKGEWSGSISRVSELQLEGEVEEVQLFDYTTLRYDRQTSLLTMERPSYVDGSLETRSCRLPKGLRHLQLFIDHSSLEVFVNNGEEVFTSRIFAKEDNRSLQVKGELNVQAWNLKNDTIDITSQGW